MMRHFPAPHAARTTLLLVLPLATAAAGCSSTAASLITGSTTSAQAPAPVTAVDRALHVAANTARAQKCGYFFDPAKLRATYIATEAAQTPEPALLDKATQAYDFTLRKVAAEIAPSGDYCDEARTADIKSNLTRHLAGDFTPPAPKATREVALSTLLAAAPRQDKLNPEYVLDPSQPQTVKTEAP